MHQSFETPAPAPAPHPTPGESRNNHLIFTSLCSMGGQLGEHSLSLLRSPIFRWLKDVWGRE